jgi:hypothetical protein
MCRTPNARRREIIAGLLQELRHPVGTYVFWPVCVPLNADDPASQLAANADMFWSGVEAFGAKGVVVAGARAAGVLEVPEAAMHDPQATVRGHFLCLLNDVEYYGEEGEEGRRRMIDAVQRINFSMHLLVRGRR